MDNTTTLNKDVFGFIFDMALSDATRRTGASGFKNLLIKDKNEDSEYKRVYESMYESVYSYADSVINGTKNSFESCVEKIELGLKEKKSVFKFGNVQKLINMTMKYLYIRYYDTDKAKNFDQCHAPMDRVMRMFVYDSYKYLKDGQKPGFKRDDPWSKMEKTKSGEFAPEYLNYQKAIDEIITTEKLNINRIQFDYKFWGRARNMDEKKDKRELGDIWKKMDV